MNANILNRKNGFLLRRFTFLYIGFSIVPFILLFYFYTQFDESARSIDISGNQFSLLTVLVGIASLLGYFGMRAALIKVVMLAESLRKSVYGKVDRNVIVELARSEGEVAELAKSFGQVFGRLEENIRELEETKKTLYEVLTKVSRALSSLENFDLLVRLILETAVEALGAKHGAIFAIDEESRFVIRAWVGETGYSDEQITKEAQPLLEWVTRENKMLILPALETKEAKLFAQPLLCAPLICRERMLGAMCISDSKSRRNYTEDELKIIANLSYQIAISFENLRLNKDMEQTYFETMSALALAVEARDPYSRGHSERVGELAVKIGVEMNLSGKDIQTLRDASRLHDIGKIGITDSILIKPGPLTVDEREIMKRHPTIGESIVKPLKTFHRLLDPIRHHHERLDGSGYPDGLTADKIPMTTRIMMVADVYDALMGDRPYRKALDIKEVFEEFESLTSCGKVDASVVSALYRVIGASSPPESKRSFPQGALSGRIS